MRRTLALLVCLALVLPCMGMRVPRRPLANPAGATTVISDSYGSDTSANYSAWGAGIGTISISGGVAHGGTNGGPNLAIHTTTSGNAGHTVTIKGYAPASTSYPETILRMASATATYPDGMIVMWVPGSSPSLISMVGASPTTVGSFSGCTLPAGPWTHLLRVSASGNVYHAYADLNDNGSYADTGEDCGTLTTATNNTGQYTGSGWDRTGSGDPTTDDFTVTVP